MSRSTPHLGHVHLRVRDVERAVAFYTDVFELDVNDRHGPFAFLTFGDHHHDIALQEVDSDAAGPRSGVGLYHAAFEVEDRDALGRIYETLDEHGVRVDPIDHGISEALYFDDPAGNGLEAYRDTRAENDRTEWQGTNEPLDPTSL